MYGSLTHIDFLNIRSLRAKKTAWSDIAKDYPYTKSALCQHYQLWLTSEDGEPANDHSKYASPHHSESLGDQETGAVDAGDISTPHVHHSRTKTAITLTVSDNVAVASFGMQGQTSPAQSGIWSNHGTRAKPIGLDEIEQTRNYTTSFNCSIHEVLNPVNNSNWHSGDRIQALLLKLNHQKYDSIICLYEQITRNSLLGQVFDFIFGSNLPKIFKWTLHFHISTDRLSWIYQWLPRL